MTDEAKQARAAYIKEWRAKNPNKEREYKERYWEKRAKRQSQKTEKRGERYV